MADQIITGVLKDWELRVLVAVVTDTARHARKVHGMEAGSAEIFAEGLTAGALMAGLQLQKGSTRVNLQVECDGPLRGFFVDAGTDGSLRGYAKNPIASVQGNRNEFRFRPLLGNSGFLSILRDQGQGEFYRSSVPLETFDLATDLERFFAASEQLPASVVLDVLPKPEDALGVVAGVLFQPLPDGDRIAMVEEARRLRQDDAFGKALETLGTQDPAAFAASLFPKGHFELTQQQPLEWKCRCSRERVLDAVQSTGPAEIKEMLEKDGKAEVTCTFCSSQYVISGDELRQMLSQPQA